jgi:hypothetical protein
MDNYSRNKPMNQTTSFFFKGWHQSKGLIVTNPSESDFKEVFAAAGASGHGLNDASLTVYSKESSTPKMLCIGYYLGVPGYAAIALNNSLLLNASPENDDHLFIWVCTDPLAIPSRFFRPLEDVIAWTLNVIRLQRLPTETKWESIVDHAIDWPDSIEVPGIGDEYEKHLLPKGASRRKAYL